jgi:hypothetical protein
VDPIKFYAYQPPAWRVEKLLGVIRVAYDYNPRSEIKALVAIDDDTRRTVHDGQGQVRERGARERESNGKW